MMARIKLMPLQKRALTQVLTATGKVQCNEDHMSRVIAPVTGQVLQLSVKVGDSVRKGETLLYLNSREAAAALTEHLESHKDLDLAEKTYVMTKDLYEHQAASGIALQQAESDLAKAKARVARTEETLQVFGLEPSEADPSSGLTPRIPIRSPISGTIIERNVTEGQFVQPEATPLLLIADLSSVWVIADIFERDLHSVRVGERAEVRTDAYPDESFVARIARISDVVDSSTRTLKVRFLVSNPGARLKPEMFASVRLFLNENATGLTVPATAVFDEGGVSFVFVRTGERSFTRRRVDVLPDGAGQVRISSGLHPTEEVVSEGSLLLRQMEETGGNS